MGDPAASRLHLLRRLLQPTNPELAAALALRRAESWVDILAFAREQVPLAVEPMAGIAELACRASRALCLTGSGAVLLEAVDDGGWHVSGGTGTPRPARSAALALLFPCTVVYRLEEPGANETARGPVALLGVYLRLISQVLALATPIAMMLVIDKVVTEGARNTLTVLVGGVALLTLFQYAFLAAGAVHGVQAVESRALPARRRLVGALLGCRDSARLSGIGWEVLQHRPNAQRFRLETRIQCLSDLAFVALLGVLMAAFSPLLLALALGFVPAYLAIATWSARRAVRHGEALAAAGTVLSRTYLEGAGAADTVRSLDLGARLTGRFARADAKAGGARLFLELWQRLSAQAVDLLQRLSLLVVMLVGVGQVIDGHLTLGQYVAFNLLCMQLGAPLLRLASYRRGRSDHRLAERSHRTLMAECRAGAWDAKARPRSRRFPEHTPVRLEARGLSLRHGQRVLLENLDVDLIAGRWTGIAGPSGCGKSTLLRTLAGLLPPAAGEVRLNGVPAADFAWPSWSFRVRLVPQHGRLFSDTVAGNLSLGNAAATMEELLAVAQVCGLSELLARLPSHLGTPVGDAGQPLSGGEMQRLCIARAVVSQPRILLLDEATAALDADAEASVLLRIRAYLPDAAVVLVSHRPTALARCDEILRLGHRLDAGPALRAMRRP